MWINSSGQLYAGDCALGDRAATAEEFGAHLRGAAKAAKGQAIAAALAYEIAWGMVWEGDVYQIDSVSQGRIGNRAQVARDCVAGARTWLPHYEGWIAADNSRDVVFTPAAFIDFAYAAHDHFTEIMLNARRLKDELIAAETLEAIEQIDVTLGWPEQE